MKTSFTPQERDAFAKAVSAVEGLHRIDEQSWLFSDFDAKEVSVDDQIRFLADRYSVAKWVTIGRQVIRIAVLPAPYSKQ